ncbi:hypothetical protein KKF61_09235 [Patescibacteria group bacterium]|nr:hypothetical protein [Patescibacteria group bacterium]
MKTNTWWKERKKWTKVKKLRTKRYYQALRKGKPIPEGAIIHTSESGLKYFEKVGKEKYV